MKKILKIVFLLWIGMIVLTGCGRKDKLHATKLGDYYGDQISIQYNKLGDYIKIRYNKIVETFDLEYNEKNQITSIDIKSKSPDSIELYQVRASYNEKNQLISMVLESASYETTQYYFYEKNRLAAITQTIKYPNGTKREKIALYEFEKENGKDYIIEKTYSVPNSKPISIQVFEKVPYRNNYEKLGIETAGMEYLDYFRVDTKTKVATIFTPPIAVIAPIGRIVHAEINGKTTDYFYEKNYYVGYEGESMITITDQQGSKLIRTVLNMIVHEENIYYYEVKGDQYPSCNWKNIKLSESEYQLEEERLRQFLEGYSVPKFISEIEATEINSESYSKYFENLRNSGNHNIKKIEKSEEKTIVLEDYPITMKNLSSDFIALAATEEDSRCDIQITGPAILLEDIEDLDIEVEIDLSSYKTPGQYTVPIIVSSKAPSLKMKPSPQEVNIVIKQK